MSQTVHIDSPAQFSGILQSSRIVVADFYADWCGPCKAIAPVYEQLSAQLSRPSQITFTKVNVDEQKRIAQTYSVSAMPTFILFKAGREAMRIKGADPKGLDAAVKQLAQEASQADSSSGSTGASSSGERWLGVGIPKGYSEISEQIEIQGLDFLNLDSSAGDKRTVFSNDKPSSFDDKNKTSSGKKDWIESDTDDQLMLFIPFQSSTKLHSLHITSIPGEPEGDDEPPMRPGAIRLYTNRSYVLGFDEADDMVSTQEVDIKESDWDAKTHTAKLDLRFVKFQNISSLVMFVVCGDGAGEKTRIDRIRLFGESGEKRAMGKLEKIGDEQGE